MLLFQESEPQTNFHNRKFKQTSFESSFAGLSPIFENVFSYNSDFECCTSAAPTFLVGFKKYIFTNLHRNSQKSPNTYLLKVSWG